MRDMGIDHKYRWQSGLLLLIFALLSLLLLLLGAALLDPGVCTEQAVLVLALGLGVQRPHLGSVLLLDGHVKLHCVAVLNK